VRENSFTDLKGGQGRPPFFIVVVFYQERDVRVSCYDGGCFEPADRPLEMQVGMVVLFATGGPTTRRAIGVTQVERVVASTSGPARLLFSPILPILIVDGGRVVSRKKATLWLYARVMA